MNGDADCGNHRNENKREGIKNRMLHRMNSKEGNQNREKNVVSAIGKSYNQ